MPDSAETISCFFHFLIQITVYAQHVTRCSPIIFTFSTEIDDDATHEIHSARL